ncbi:hypothetical protein AB0J80_19855 [Actinoplanes sp. NPDC049548]|uniref:hypothetical protein n=1 Tax=Actinoplanes sp. NPDC049548 TaxID=3155152 RepID=UPI00343685E5
MQTPDRIRESARQGRIVLWEESARDGAQGKTLLSADFRVRLARQQGAMFGTEGPGSVVFSAGFPAVCKEEFEATRRVAMEAAGSVSAAAVCRATLEDVRQACRAVQGAPDARVMIVVPASDEIADAMVHRPAAQALEEAVSLVHAVRDSGSGLHVDVGFADAPRGDVAQMADAASRLTAEGAGTIIVADTTGDLLHPQAAELFGRLQATVSDDVVLATHLHNDLGSGLANTLEAVRAGVRVVSSSWLGVAERAGMVATEQLLFVLTHRSHSLLGTPAELWGTAPDLTRLPEITRTFSAETGLPLTVTMPIVGTGVGTISTGTPFVRPATFQPFEPSLVGVEPKVLLTHLASGRVVRTVAAQLGYELDRAETAAVLRWVKSEAFRRNEAVIPDDDLALFLRGMRAGSEAVPAAA